MQKKLITTILILALLLSSVACGSAAQTPAVVEVTSTPEASAVIPPSPSPVPTEEPESEEEEDMEDVIYNTLLEGFGNRFAACAVIGNMRRESRLCPYRYEMDGTDYFTKSKAFIDNINADLTNPSDISRFYFTNYAPEYTDRTGFGLCQWTDISRKGRLYDYAVATGCLLDDPVMQCNFIIYEMSTFYPDLFETFQTSEDLDLLVNYFFSIYEKGLATEDNMYWRVNAARYYFQKFYPDEAKANKKLRPYEPMDDVVWTQWWSKYVKS